ncbi:MAG: 3-hydroxyacyl-CoA dehydrogenase NAD-binding domain-containing protein, partial [Pirellulales bacterium]|nr:3-hydroxyacyl-CoA dehydrogenase NAD-binding domain-containing protein [Pirellulales bacterium]
MQENTSIRRVLVLGAGTMGQRIAAHCYIHGYDVVLYDTNPHAMDNAGEKLVEQVQHFMRWKTYIHKVVGALEHIQVETDAATAAADCDLLIESVPERLRLKQETLKSFDSLCPPHTIFTTNTSSMLPSLLAESSGRPSRFAALHFFPLAFVTEIMGHSETDPAILDQLETFARSIGQIPIRCHKENQGHVFNAMYMSLVSNALALAADGVASLYDIDRCWMEVTDMPEGPLAGIDQIGLDTALDVTDFLAHLQQDEATKR